MVRISDILRRGRVEEEPRKKRLDEEAKVKEKKVPLRLPKKVEKKKVPLKARKKGVKKRAPTELVAEEGREGKGKPPAAQVEIARMMMEKTRIGRPEPEEIYQELIALIKDVLAKGARNKPIEGKEIVAKISRLVDQIALAGDELMGLIGRSTPDNYLYGHSVNVCILSIGVGLGLGYNKSRLNELGVSSLLHDVGMIKVIDIAQQPRGLSKKEYEAIKEHPIYGVEILEKARDLTKVAIYVVHEQHERMTGAGYPRGLKDDEINEYARIVGLVDAYEAMTHPRPYRKKFLPYETAKEILKDKALFDPQVLKALIEQIGIYPVGSWVKLNTDEIGRVVRLTKAFPLRPTVNVIFGPDGRKLAEVKSVDLTRHLTLYIKKPLDNSELEARFPASK